MFDLIPTLNTGYWWLDAYLYFCLSMFALMAYRRWLNNKLSGFMKLATSPVLIAFALADAFGNFAVLWVLGPRPYGTWSISERFAFYRDSAYSSGRNKTIANITCWLINQFDDNHC